MPAPGRRPQVAEASPQPLARPPVKESRMPYFALGGVCVLLVGVVVWLNIRVTTPPPQPVQPAAEPSALSSTMKRDPEKERMDQELKKIKDALAAREEKDVKDAQDAESRDFAKWDKIRAVQQEELEHARSYLASNFFDGDNEAVQAYLDVQKDVLFAVSVVMNDDDPTNDLTSQDEVENFIFQRLLSRFEKNPVLSEWMKRHQREPRKFIQELLRTQPKRPAPEARENKFDFKKYTSAGSGFWISSDGWILTNEHVVSDSKVVDLRLHDGKIIQAKVIKTDEAKDLALLKADTAPGSWLSVSKGGVDLQLGRTVFTVGYPDPVVQGVEPKFTDGRISAASGIGDRKDSYQITVPVQHGNSGGPLVDFATGWVVGVVNAKLMGSDGLVADNVSYAIKGSVVSGFFESVPEAKTAAMKVAPKPITKGSEREAIDRTTESSVLILRPR